MTTPCTKYTQKNAGRKKAEAVTRPLFQKRQGEKGAGAERGVRKR